MDRTLRALNRFGLGARVGERRRIRDPRGWLRAQLEGAVPIATVADIASPQNVADALRAHRAAARSPEERRRARQHLNAITMAEARAALGMRVVSQRPFVERLVAFWSNHLCVSAGARVLVGPLAGSYERDVIRRHTLGRFEDMVLASAKHPAMLLYLDNAQSIGPRSRGAQRGRAGGAQRGLNENYARELLELHTLGVSGGYTQQDVQELAKILTGWTVRGLARRGEARRAGMGRRRQRDAQPLTNESNGPIEFVFREQLHEPGIKTVLRTQYSEEGVSEGEGVIRALCRHPSTARFVASKIVTHFIADDPPAAAVERLSRVFRETDGDLRMLASALVETPEAWREDTRKFRTPQDWLVAVLRAFDAPDVPDSAAIVLRQLRHPLWSPQAPKGFADAVQDWADPDALLNRAELARTIARRVADGAPDPKALLDAVELRADDPLRTLVNDTSISADERIALAIASPAFQWR